MSVVRLISPSINRFGIGQVWRWNLRDQGTGHAPGIHATELRGRSLKDQIAPPLGYGRHNLVVRDQFIRTGVSVCVTESAPSRRQHQECWDPDCQQDSRVYRCQHSVRSLSAASRTAEAAAARAAVTMRQISDELCQYSNTS